MGQDTDTYNADSVATPKWLSHYWLIVAALIAFQGIILFYMGQPIISQTGGLQMWCGDVQSRENSQHLTDWYTFTHIIHGIGYYWILRYLTPGSSMPFRSIIAILMEVMWEIVENTSIVINRFRQTGVGYGYYGDSIINSISDTFAMLFGFYLSNVLPCSVVVTYAVFTELLCAYQIRDNFALSVIQLIHPFESISSWQTENF